MSAESGMKAMQILYLMNAAPFQKEEMVQKALSLVEPVRRERVVQSKDNKNRALSLAAGVLLSYAINRWEEEKMSGLRPVDAWQVIAFLADATEQATIKIPVTETHANGKPYLKNMPDLYFNLSHSGDYVICALADSEIGVDIQQYRKNIKAGVLKKVLHESEKDLYQACTQEEKEAFFFQIWAAKEAYAKYTGEGLGVDFRLLMTDADCGEILDTRTGCKDSLQFFEELPDYAIAVVSGNM